MLVRRNSTGVAVGVTVGYSVSVDCDGDGEPDSAIDGANTITTDFVTEDGQRLIDTSRDFLEPAAHC
jgi:hypothetical protein